MKDINRKFADTLERSLLHYNRLTVKVEESFGSQLFPECNIEPENNTIYFNEKVEVVLALYKLAMSRKWHTGRAVMEYVLFQAFLEQENYEQAGKCLGAFEEELAALPFDQLSDEELEHENDLVPLLVYFMYSHEAAHVIFAHNAKSKEAELQQTRIFLNGQKKEMEELRSRYSIKDIVKDPTVQRNIEAIFTTKADRKKYQQQLENSSYNPEYVGNVANGTNLDYLEELSADRVAWLTLLDILKTSEGTDEDILTVNLSILATMATMELNRVLQSICNPALHGKFEYDGLKVHLRQQAFKHLLKQYSPKVDRLYKHQFSDMTIGLGSILTDFNKSMQGKSSELMILYQDVDNESIPNHSIRNRLNTAMDNIVHSYLHL